MSDMVDPEPDVHAIRLAPNDGFPNNPTLPVLVYRGALSEPDPGAVARLLHENDWVGSWRDGVYGFHHFHSNAHEVLACCAGSARVRFGGPDGPVVEIGAGDVVIQPAGTSHKNDGSSGDFLIVGAYPAGQEHYDMMRGDPAEVEAAVARIAQVPVPASDPIYGASGPLREHWQGSRSEKASG